MTETSPLLLYDSMTNRLQHLFSGRIQLVCF